MFLKQSTSVVISFGPFVSQNDGVTLVTSLVSALDNGTTGIKLSKNGGALTIRHATVTSTTYDGYGNYLITLDATDTATLGSLRIQFSDATTNLPVWADYQIVPANVYDSIISGSDLLQVDMQQLINTAFTEGGAGRLAGAFSTLFNVAAPVLTTASVSQTGDTFSLIGTNGSNLTALATAAQINALAVNTRANLSVPVEIENPDSSTQVYKIRLNLFDVEGNMEAPDSTPTIALTNAAGTDRSSRLSIASNPSTGVYTWNYTATAGDTEEQLIWVFTVVEGGLTRTYSSTSYVVEESAYRFSSSDRSNLTAIFNKLPTNNIADQTDMLAEFSLLPTASEIVAFMDANSVTLSNISNAIANLNDISISEIGNVVDTSLATYDGPTNAEMIARTLVSASYATAANQTTIMSKTNLIPASPAAIGSAMTLADGSITDATITLPTEAIGTPSTFLQLMMWLAGCFGWRKFVKDTNTNKLTQYMANGTTIKTESTFTSAGGIDTINKAS